MAKVKTKYVCKECGYQSLRWMGKCPGCQEWETLVEEIATPKNKQSIASVPGTHKPEQITKINSKEEK